MSKRGKIVLLANHIHQLVAQLYLERVKLRMVQKKALTAGDKTFGELYKQLRGRVSAMEAERDHFIEQLEKLKSEIEAEEQEKEAAE